MFKDQYKQANDSLRPRKELLWEMEQKQRKPVHAYARWSTVAACALVVLALGLFFGGRFFGGAKSMEMNTSGAAADAAPREMADTAALGGYAMDTTETTEDAWVEEAEEEAFSEEPPQNVETVAGAEIAAIGENLLCRFRQDTCLLEICALNGQVLGTLELPEAASCTAMELEGDTLKLYLEGDGVILVDISNPAVPTMR